VATSQETTAVRTPRPETRRSIAGMVLANRPWQLVSDLSKVIVATLATAAFLVVNTGVWPLADQLGTGRLMAIGVLSVALLALWLVLAHELWERPATRRDRRRVMRANTATALTLFVGLLIAYCVLFGLVLSSAVLVIPGDYFESNLKHPTDFGDRAALAWLICSLATVAGAIGSGLESDGDVRETVRRYRADAGSRGDER
jgi:uncharacterized membrane protein